MIKNQYYTLYICLSDHDFKPRSIFFCSMKIKFLNINIFINFVSLPGKSLIKSEKLCIPRNNTRNFLLIRFNQGKFKYHHEHKQKFSYRHRTSIHFLCLLWNTNISSLCWPHCNQINSDSSTKFSNMYWILDILLIILFSHMNEISHCLVLIKITKQIWIYSTCEMR